MSKGLSREFTWLIVSFWFFLFLGWLTGLWTVFLFGYVIFYVGRQIWSMYQFEQWIHGRSKKSLPPVSGFWNEISYQVSKKQRALEKHAYLHQNLSEQFRSASMALPMALVSLNKKHQIEWFNQTAEKLLRVRHQDVGRKMETLVRHPQFVQYLKNQAFDKPLFLETLMGQQRVYRCQVFEYYKGNRLVVFEDVHEFYHLAQIRKDFVANASHELRTPLTVLNGYLEMMIDMSGDFQETWAKPLIQMHQQSERMGNIIEDLLTLSRIESESLVSEQETVDVVQILKDAAFDNQQLYGEKYLIQFEIEDSLLVIGLAEPLKSVFSNLISNAFRYTLDGGRVTVKWFSDSEGAHFEVHDTGIGIASEHLGRLTERFYRVDKARSRDTGGTGLGLAIVKHVLENHDSELIIDSVYGRGSIFGCVFKPEKIVHSTI